MLCPPFPCRHCGKTASCYHSDLGELRENNTDSITYCSIACRDEAKAADTVRDALLSEQLKQP